MTLSHRRRVPVVVYYWLLAFPCCHDETRSVALASFLMIRPSIFHSRYAGAPGVHCRSSTPTTFRFEPLSVKDWDAILRDLDDDNDTNNEHGTGRTDAIKVPPDMQYNLRNCQRQNRHYLAIRDAGGMPNLIHDVYARDPQSDVWWFIGKVARVSDITVEQAVARQWPMIESHAANLRPLELFACRGVMELWVAPGDSELMVAYNNPDVTLRRMNRHVEGSDKVKNVMIGFLGEIYDPGEEGFRTWRLPDGRPARPEIKGPQSDDDDYRAPTAEEMERLQKALEGKDINDIYEEQQRRLQDDLQV